ncbi:GNAT family N-acetyltransferase [soil metagenome]
MSQHPSSSEDATGATGSEAVTVVDAADQSRFEVTVDGVLAGFTLYLDSAGAEGRATERTFPHTVVEKEFGGRGLATLLIRTALDAARVGDLAVIPECSAVRGFIAKHPEYLDLVPSSRRAEFDL